MKKPVISSIRNITGKQQSRSDYHGASLGICYSSKGGIITADFSSRTWNDTLNFDASRGIKKK